MDQKSTRELVLLLAVLMAALFEGSTALSICGMSDDGFRACKPSVTKPEPVDPPPSECCTALSQADLACLCSYRNSPMLPVLGIDPNLAMALPAKCNLTLPANC